MPGPVIYSLPDPRAQLFADYVSRAQQNRYEEQRRRHFEKIEKEKRDKQLTGLAAGALVGGVAGLAMAPATALATVPAMAGTMPLVGAGTALTGVSTGTALTFGLGGAVAGAQAGTAFGEGDIAGGVVAAGQGVLGGLQTRRDVQNYGYIPSREDKLAMAGIAKGLGTTPTKLFEASKAAGMALPDYISAIESTAAQEKLANEELSSFAKEFNVESGALRSRAAELGSMQAAMNEVMGDAARKADISDLSNKYGVPESLIVAGGKTHPGGVDGYVLELKQRARAEDAEDALNNRYATLLAESQFISDAAAQASGNAIESRVSGEDYSAILGLDKRMRMIDAAVQRGDITKEQGFARQMQIKSEKESHARLSNLPRRGATPWEETFFTEGIDDGQGGKRMALFFRTDPTPREPNGTQRFAGWVEPAGKDTTADDLLKLQQGMMRAQYGAPVSLDEVVDLKIAAEEKAAELQRRKQAGLPLRPDRSFVPRDRNEPASEMERRKREFQSGEPPAAQAPSGGGAPQHVLSMQKISQKFEAMGPIEQWNDQQISESADDAIAVLDFYKEAMRRGYVPEGDELGIIRLAQKIAEGG